MSDILLSVGLQKGTTEVSQIQSDLQEIISRIDKNPPKVKVGLQVDQSAINTFKSQLTKIVNSVSLSSGAPITVNISGLGDITAQANEASEAIKRSTDSITKQGTAFSTVLQKYEQAHALIRKNANANETASQSYKGLAAQVDLFQRALEQARQESIDINVAFAKNGVDVSTALQNMTTAMSAFRAEMEHTGTSGTVTSKQLYDVVTQMESLLNSNKGASGFESYTNLSSQFNQLSAAMKLVRDDGLSVEEAFEQIGIDGSNALNQARTAMSALKTQLSEVTKVTGNQLLDAYRQMKSLLNDNPNASGLNTYGTLSQQVAEFEAKIISSNGSVRSAEEVLQQFGNSATGALNNARSAMSAFRAEMEHTGTSGKPNVESLEEQIRRLDTIIQQTEASLEKWTKARSGKTSGNYQAIEQEVEALKQLRTQLASSGQAVSDFNVRVGQSTATIRTNSTAIRDAGEDTKSALDEWGGLAEKFTSWLSVSQAIMTVINTLKKMVRTVIELDSAMTELKKVTDETDATYNRFMKNAASRAKAVGAAMSDVITATAD